MEPFKDDLSPPTKPHASYSDSSNPVVDESWREISDFISEGNPNAWDTNDDATPPEETVVDSLTAICSHRF